MRLQIKKKEKRVINLKNMLLEVVGTMLINLQNYLKITNKRNHIDLKSEKLEALKSEFDWWRKGECLTCIEFNILHL